MNRLFLYSFVLSVIGNMIGAAPAPQYVKGIASGIAIFFAGIFMIVLIIAARQKLRNENDNGCDDYEDACPCDE